MPNIRPINQKLRRLRILAGLTHKQAAAKIGVSSSNLSHWERGRTVPRESRLTKIADVYGCTVTELLDCLEPEGGESRG